MAIATLVLPFARAFGQQAQCSYGQWSEPALIGNPRQPVQEPNIAVLGTTLVVAGIDRTIARRQAATRGSPVAQWEPAIRIRDVDGRRIPAPDGHFFYLFPRVAFDRGGALQLIWGEPDALEAGGARTGGDPHDVRVAELWQAAYRHGRWSIPRRLYRARSLDWDPAATAGIVHDASGGLHVAVSGYPLAGGWVLARLVLEGERWRVQEVPTPAPPIYPSVAARSSRAVTMGYVASPPGYPPASLFIIRTADGGATWSKPRPVHGATAMPASEPRVVVATAGDVHFVWVQRSAAGRVTASSLWHAASTDGGRTWRDVASTQLAAMTNRMQALVDPCGTVHVALDEFNDRAPRLVYRRFIAGSWSKRFTPLGNAAAPSLTLRGRHLYLAGEASDVGSEGEEQGGVPSARYVTLRVQK